MNTADWIAWHDKKDGALTKAIAQFVLGEFGYRGMFHEGIVYRAGNFVTLGGSLWHCKRDRDHVEAHHR
jgi:hypothetical protein